MEYAKSLKGCKIIHVMAPCPTGWGYDPARTVEVGKLAVECGMWHLAEYKDDEFSLTYAPRELKPVDEYLKMQKRFRHLKPEDIAAITEVPRPGMGAHAETLRAVKARRQKTAGITARSFLCLVKEKGKPKGNIPKSPRRNKAFGKSFRERA